MSKDTPTKAASKASSSAGTGQGRRIMVAILMKRKFHCRPGAGGNSLIVHGVALTQSLKLVCFEGSDLHSSSEVLNQQPKYQFRDFTSNGEAAT